MPRVDGAGMGEAVAELVEVDEPAAGVALQQRGRGVVVGQVPENNAPVIGS